MILSRVPVSSKIKHYKDADGVEHFDMENTNHDGQTKSRSRVLSGAEKSAKIKEHDVSEYTNRLVSSSMTPIADIDLCLRYHNRENRSQYFGTRFAKGRLG